MSVKRLVVMAAMVAVLFCNSAEATIRITEYMYQGSTAPPAEAGEFVELTNIGTTPIDMTGWSFDDDSRDPGVFDLSGFGTVQPGESVVFTDWNAELFRNSWGLDSEVKIIGFSEPGLGRNDEINIYDADDNLIDRLTYGDQSFPGSIRTQTISGNIPLAALGANDAHAAVLSANGDIYGSFQSARGEWGNPGTYAAIPEPTTLGLMSFGVCVMAMRMRRASSKA